MELSWELGFWLALIGFAAGFMDSIVGGGGLVGTPGLMNLFPDWPILQIVGTNRTSSICGTSVASWNYFRRIPPEWRLILPSCAGAALAAWVGVQIAELIPAEKLKAGVVVAMLGLLVYLFFHRQVGQQTQRAEDRRWEPWLALAIGVTCGFYNGLIGPGTGTFLMFGFVSLLGLDFLHSSALAKPTNVAADLSSYALLVYWGYVVWSVAIPLLAANMLGSYVGSRLAIWRGSQFVRSMFFLVSLALLARFVVGWWLSGTGD